ncbi:MAG: ABC transporter permease [Candidatus Paracaedibacteraceae bacterium]|nr:ABC transporter permease [Candidatus Paracaedibacteraceae bacterium]
MILLCLFLGLACLWSGLSFGLQIPEYFLPSPLNVGHYIMDNWQVLGRHTLLTMLEIGGGILAALAAALVTGYWSYRSQKAQHGLMSFFLVMQAIPMFVLLPLFVLWFGADEGTKIMVVALAAYFPMAASLIQGLSQCPQVYKDLARTFHATPRAQWIHIFLPSAMPHLLNGIRIAAVHAPVTVLAADWIGSTNGLGYLIMLGHGRMQLDMMFACILIFIILALALNGLVIAIQRGILYWKTEQL